MLAYGVLTWFTKFVLSRIVCALCVCLLHVPCVSLVCVPPIYSMDIAWAYIFDRPFEDFQPLNPILTCLMLRPC